MAFFYDTNVLLNLQGKIYESNEKFYLSSITLKELEGIKTSGFKDEQTKYEARQALHLLDTHQDMYEVIIFTNELLENISHFDLPQTDDTKILSCAFVTDAIFYTMDLACKTLARYIGIEVYEPDTIEEEYTGYKEVNMHEADLGLFYSMEMNSPKNKYDLLTNQYLIMKQNGRIVDKYRWDGKEYCRVSYGKAESRMFGKVTPKDGDIYQQLALDALNNSQITMLRGKAGSGKSYLAFGYMFDQLEKGRIDKIIVFCNTVATKGSAKLGYYPGSRTEKLLDSQIGNLLESKLGDRFMVEKMIEDGKLVLLPMSDIRGYDTSGMNAAVYITEAQNLDIELMRLALQRIGEDSICILDGDSAAQVDLSMYAGVNNGMKRVSDVFKGQDFYAEVTLQNIKRSKVAAKAQEL